VSAVSPLERRALLALISLIRDRESDPSEWCCTTVPLAALYERCYVLDPAKSWELQRRNQRQAMRRALGRLHGQGCVDALALAWASVRDGEAVEWHGGGRRSHSGSDYARRYGEKTPNWKLVGLSPEGIALALALERELAEAS
jgi:hypothetical protein